MGSKKAWTTGFLCQACQQLISFYNSFSSSVFYRRYFKRLLDLAGSLCLILSLSWLWLSIILLYLVSLEFPVFFRQRRIGLGERPFTLLKFRTLRDTGRGKFKRFFPGNIIRAASLDELPQLLNVLKGDMSLVGPRPLPVAYLSLFSEEQRKRHSIRPGITGWAQVNGRHQISWPEKFRLDLDYIRNISFKLDVKIVLRTVHLLVSFKPDVSLNEKAFTGEH